MLPRTPQRAALRDPTSAAMTPDLNACNECGRQRGALCLVPTRRGATIGNTISEGRRVLLCDQCIVDRLVTA